MRSPSISPTMAEAAHPSESIFFMSLRPAAMGRSYPYLPVCLDLCREFTTQDTGFVSRNFVGESAHRYCLSSGDYWIEGVRVSILLYDHFA